MRSEIKEDERFIRVAIMEAEKSLKKGNAPFGAVLVKDNKIVSRDHCTTVSDNDPTAHAEIKVIRRVCRRLKTKNLNSYTLYSNIEPCVMCAAACVRAGISKIIYGASIKDISALVPQISIGCKDVIKAGYRKIKVMGGLLRKEALKHF
jgi:guanine deaminase